MTINTQLLAIVAKLDSDVAALISAEAFGGELTPDDIRRYAVKAPAARVGCLGFEDLALESGHYALDLQWIIVLVTRDAAVRRGPQMLGLVVDAAKVVAANDWGMETGRPKNVRARNLFSGDVDKHGLAVWAITWTQRLDLADLDTSTLDDFLRVHSDWDTAPLDGVVDIEGMLHLGGTLMSAYGELTVTTAVATAIAVADTYQKAAGTMTLGSALDMDAPVNGRLRHAGTVSKPFLATVNASVTVASDATVTLAIAKNGMPDETLEIEQKMTTAQGAGSFSITGIFDLNEDDYLEVWAKADDTISLTTTKLAMVAVAT